MIISLDTEEAFDKIEEMRNSLKENKEKTKKWKKLTLPMKPKKLKEKK